MKLPRLIKSINYAINGISTVFQKEKNFRLHVLIAVIVVWCAIFLRLGAVEVSILAMAICMVLALEMINSAIEYTWNKLEPDHHPVVGMIKDVMAGAVLVATLGAAFVGLVLIVFKF